MEGWARSSTAPEDESGPDDSTFFRRIASDAEQPADRFVLCHDLCMNGPHSPHRPLLGSFEKVILAGSSFGVS